MVLKFEIRIYQLPGKSFNLSVLNFFVGKIEIIIVSIPGAVETIKYRSVHSYGAHSIIRA